MIAWCRDRWQQWTLRVPLAPVGVASTAGICADRWVSIAVPVWAAGLFIALLAMTFLKMRRVNGLWLLLVIVFCLFGMRHHLQEDRYESASILRLLTTESEPTTLVGVVDQTPRIELASLERWATAEEPVVAPEILPDSWVTHLVVSARSMRRSSDALPVSGRVLALVDGDVSDLRPGDRVGLSGPIRLLDGPNNPGATDRRAWGMQRDIHARMRILDTASIERLPAEPVGSATRIHRWISARSVAARNTLIARLDPDQRGLAVALVLGQRDLVDDETNEMLLVTGTAHLLSVSGLHLGIVVVLAGGLATLLNLSLNRKIAMILAVALLYVFITGGRPPVLRAGILLGTGMLALVVARPSASVNTLFLAAILIAWWSPMEVFAIGTQLSFLAVGTLLTCSRTLRPGQTAASEERDRERRLDELFEQSQSLTMRWTRFVGRSIARALWFSGCVTLVTTPLVWQQFNVVSPVSIVINVILTPLMTIALSAGLATVIVGGVSAIASSFAGWVCGTTLSLMQHLLVIAADVQGGHFWLPSPSLFWVAMFYAGLVACLLIGSGRRRATAIFSGATAWFVVALWQATTPPPLPPQTTEATFVDVGHGTAAILRSSADEVWLYDCGWLGNSKGSSASIERTLWSMGVTRLRCIVLSHADADHYNALPGLAKRFRIDRIITPPGMLAEQGELLGDTIDAIEQYKIAVSELHLGDRFSDVIQAEWGERVSVLHPPEVRIDGSDNANSLVLRLDQGDRTLLLPGDLEPPGTSVLIDTPRPPPGGVLMAPHHGSLQRDAESVTRWARPAETVVSGGQRAKRPEVTELLASSGSGVYVTSETGAVRVRIRAREQPEVRVWRIDPW